MEDRWLTAKLATTTLLPMSLRQRYLFVCTNCRAADNPRGSCAAKGSEAVQQALKEELAARGLNQQQARVCKSSCLDQCATGISILVEPDHFIYGHVALADVAEIVQSLVHSRRVERLVLTAEELAEG
jgi:(2Fe-2S) ferredoxin